DENTTNDQWILDPPPFPKKTEKKPSQILELISPHPTHHPSPAGKTSLLYLTTTLAILPPSLSNVHLNGKNAAIVIIDPLSHFSSERLAEVALTYLVSKLQESGRDVTSNALRREILECVKNALVHVHIFRPVSWESMLETLGRMPEYLFDGTRHLSTQRHVHALVLEDVDVFTSYIRATSASTTTTTTTTPTNPLTPASAQLTTHLTTLLALLSCPVILTSHSATPSSFRPALPTSWPRGTQVTRLAVRRVEVIKFAPGLSVEEAESERAQRWEVVRRARFEAWKVGSGGKGTGVGRGEEGFVFRVGRSVDVERGKESN
ncbi:hypothetical protein CC80DRAFT_282504, partial [Byssothecium circinans]